jgi:lipoprotein-anchoring transpeptidase ErfK/SrfK
VNGPARALTTLACAFALCGAAQPAALAATAYPLPGPTRADPLAALAAPGDSVKLSDERRVTRWSHANAQTPIRTLPSTAARSITRLRYLNEDKRPEVYLVLSATLDAAGDAWLRIRIPRRPNGQKGWVPVDMLSQLYVVRTHLVIDRRTTRATLYKEGRRIWGSPVGVGKAATPTPGGKFYIRELLRGDGGLYGTWAFGTSAYASITDWPNGGVVGIHGTDQPELIPGRPSHGCVRVPNPKVNQLARLMPIGTPVEIR